MKLIIDSEAKQLTITENDNTCTFDLYTKEAFKYISRYWLKLGWNQKYSYTFTWLGRPIIQLPEDMIRIQEIIYQVKPDVIIETGIAHGGSLIFYACLCHAIGKGKIIGIDCEIRAHNLEEINQHPLKEYLTLIEGDSIAADTFSQVKKLIKSTDKVLVILDSNHTYQHVYQELLTYSDLVTSGSYIIVADGIMHDLHDVPRGASHWQAENPAQAAIDFSKQRQDFILEQPKWLFNESDLENNITYYPFGYLRKI